MLPELPDVAAAVVGVAGVNAVVLAAGIGDAESFREEHPSFPPLAHSHG